MENDEISEYLRNGFYRCVEPRKNGKLLKSPVWKFWHHIVDEDGDPVPNKIACIKCNTVQDYSSTQGTTNLDKHRASCLNTTKRKSLASLSNNAIKTIKTSVNEKVVQFVAQDIRSFRITSGPGFLALADKPISIGHHYGPVKAQDILPHRTTVSKLVSKDAETKQALLKSQLVELQKQGLAITIDLWTEDHTKCHYIGMNAHFIHEGVMKEATLHVKELDELSKNAENIHIEIVNMLTTYEIDIDNVIFVSDRGGEIIAALNDYAERLNCAAHLLKNIVDEMLHKIGDENPVKILLENCRRLVTYVKRSNVQYRLPSGLKAEVLSRWNATLYMMESVKKAQETEDLFEYLSSKGKSHLLTDIDNNLLDEVMELLDPFLEATLQFEARKKPTIHLVALHRIEMEEHLTTTQDDSSAISEMKHFGLAYLREKLEMDNIHKKEVFFHPKLKKLSMFADGPELIAEIRREVAMVTADDDDDDDRDNDDDDAEVVYRPVRKRRKIDPDRIIDDFSNSNFGDQSLDEVQQYINSFIVVPPTGTIDLCKFWHDNPSSASAESTFSLGGFVVNDKRVRLNPSVVNDILVLKSVFDNMNPSN